MGTPRSRSLSEIKDKLLHPATTSHFVVSIAKPEGLTSQYLSQNGVNFDQDKLELLCSDAILPGSSLATHDISGDYHGSTHRHAYRRLYDDRIDLSFYVDATTYLPIRFFEVWIKYIAGESIASDEKGSVEDANYFYRMNYPKLYIQNSGLEVTKFERSSMGSAKGKAASQLAYKFVNYFPIAIQSMPISYDSSSLLKCTVSLSYVRYYIDPTPPTPDSVSSSQTAALTPEQQAQFNATSNNLTGTGALATSVPGFNVGGIPTSSAQSSANTVTQ